MHTVEEQIAAVAIIIEKLASIITMADQILRQDY
jgi:hypothetical protein